MFDSRVGLVIITLELWCFFHLVLDERVAEWIVNVALDVLLSHQSTRRNEFQSTYLAVLWPEEVLVFHCTWDSPGYRWLYCIAREVFLWWLIKSGSGRVGLSLLRQVLNDIWELNHLIWMQFPIWWAVWLLLPHVLLFGSLQGREQFVHELVVSALIILPPLQVLIHPLIRHSVKYEVRFLS